MAVAVSGARLRGGWGPAAAAVLALALGLRIAAAVGAEALWRDEANDVFLARETETLGELAAALAEEGSPPLRFVVERAVHRAFPDSVVPARVVVVAFGTLAVGVAMRLALLCFGPAVALGTGLVMAISPYLIRWSVELRGYALYQLLALCWAWALLSLLARPGRRRALLAGVVGGGLLLTHYYGLFLMATAGAAAAAVGRRRALPLVAVSLATSAALFAPWLALFVDQATGALRGWAVPSTKGIDLVAAAKLPLGPPSLALALIGQIAAIVALRKRSGSEDGGVLTRADSTGAGLAPVGERAGAAVWVLLAGGLGGNVVAWLAQLLPFRARLEPPYLIGMAVVLLPVTVFGLTRLVGRLGSSTARGLAVSTLVLVAGALAALDAGRWLRPRSPAPAVARYLDARERPGDLVVVLPAPVAITLAFYSRGTSPRWAPPFQRELTHLPWSELERRLADPAIPRRIEDEVRRHLATGGRLWLVTSGIDPLRPQELEDRIESADTEYERALLRIASGVVRVARRAGEPVRQPVPRRDPSTYWEPMELWLVEGGGAR